MISGLSTLTVIKYIKIEKKTVSAKDQMEEVKTSLW